MVARTSSDVLLRFLDTPLKLLQIKALYKIEIFVSSH
jgi:hypothetical protein